VGRKDLADDAADGPDGTPAGEQAGSGEQSDSGGARASQIDPARLIFLDESGVTTEMTRRYG